MAKQKIASERAQAELAAAQRAQATAASTTQNIAQKAADAALTVSLAQAKVEEAERNAAAQQKAIADAIQMQLEAFTGTMEAE